MFAVIMLIVAAAISAYSAYSSGQQAKDVGEYNAKVAEQQAKAAQQKAAFEEDIRREKGRKLLASQKVAAAKSGATLSSFLPIFQQTARDTELDALAIRYAGNIGDMNRLNEATLSRMQGKQAYKAGVIKSGGTILTGAGKAYTQYKGL